jgi:hypothetical protein
MEVNFQTNCNPTKSIEKSTLHSDRESKQYLYIGHVLTSQRAICINLQE